MNFLHFFLLLCVIFALLDPDPDPLTPLNPDPIGIRIRNPVPNSETLWNLLNFRLLVPVNEQAVFLYLTLANIRNKGDRDQHADAERWGGPAHTRQPLPLPDDLRHTRQGDSLDFFISSPWHPPFPFPPWGFDPLLSTEKLILSVKLETTRAEKNYDCKHILNMITVQ